MKKIELDGNLVEVSPSPIYAFIAVLPSSLLIIAITFVALKFLPILMVASFVLLFIAWYKYLFLRYTAYSLDTEVLKIKTGILAKRVDSLELYRVKDYVVTQSFLMRIFNIMTITLYTKDLTDGKILITGIPASDLPDIIRKYVQEARLSNKIFEIN